MNYKSLEAAYESGAWAAFDMVLDYLNTLDDKTVAKKDIYHAVYKMKPPRHRQIEEIAIDSVDSICDSET